jgi:DNA-binding response OmpR family regulator
METTELHILAIGRNTEIMEVMNRLLNTPDNWTGVTVTTNEAAITAFEQEHFDIVLLCAGVTPEEEQALTTRFRGIHPGVILKRHFGGGSGLLKNEIQYVLDNRHKQI